MKRFATFIASAVAVFGLAGAVATSASAESASSDVSITGKGTLYKDALAPVNMSLSATVLPDTGQLKLRELNNVKFTIPSSFAFDTAGTPVCTNDVGQIDEESANAPTAAVVAKCPNSVVGGGTATINVAGYVAAPVTDPILTVFNGGNDANGNAQLFIQGYSATVVPGGHGVFMKAVLENGVMDVYVPTLATNSSVTTFTINIPGAVGADPNFAQAICNTGSLGGTADLTLGEYDKNTGQYTNVSTIGSNTTTTPCVGEASSTAKGKFKSLKVKGSKKAKKGKKVTYKVKIKNVGGSNIKKIKVKAKGKGAKGKASGGSLKAGKSKTIKVKVKFKKTGKIKTKFTASGKGVKTVAKKIKVKVKK
ncbi:MAG: hypothetical protein IPK93_11635 [Solirubrobacterales bacterium]|nr:hypothetical protein [Solirubrobacterales bacterium]